LNAHELLAFVYIFVECMLPWQLAITYSEPSPS